jgi:hypothetical protein
VARNQLGFVIESTRLLVVKGDWVAPSTITE